MKVGILTFHIADNYGAVLQCYALQEFLKSLGYEVCVLDYQQPYLKRIYRRSDLRMFLANLLIGHRFNIQKLKYRNLLITKFNQFRRDFLTIDQRPFNNISSIPTNIDLYVIGSDQLWNYSVCGDSYDPVFWGCFKSKIKGKIATYAVSSSVDSLMKMPKELLSLYLENFDSISVRESVLIDSLKSFTSKQIVSNVDPTLLVENSLWDNIANKSTLNLPEKYILVYYVRNFPGNNDVIFQKAKHLSKKIGIPVVCMNRQMTYSPVDFVHLFKNAVYVMTSSFHATVFSIIFKRNLTAFVYGDRFDERYVSLLNTLGLNECIASLEFDPEEIPTTNYQDIDKHINKFKEESRIYFSSYRN